ncbi:MAG: hypothetical protein IKD99_06520 [Erysipelotrichaceae bacterium]|nr:hypothetical protein [Erysipelotrichaceae bacterium]
MDEKKNDIINIVIAVSLIMVDVFLYTQYPKWFDRPAYQPADSVCLTVSLVFCTGLLAFMLIDKKDRLMYKIIRIMLLVNVITLFNFFTWLPFVPWLLATAIFPKGLFELGKFTYTVLWLLVSYGKKIVLSGILKNKK